MQSKSSMLNRPYLVPDERRLISRFWQSASGFWRGPSAWRVWLLAVFLVTTVVLQLLLQYRLNYWNRDFFNALARKDRHELWLQALVFVPLATAMLTLASASVWGRMTMQRKWREWLSKHMYDYWLENGNYRRLRFMLGEHQTPEYRIAEDARVATDAPIDLVVGLLSSVLTAITFIAVLWSVGGGITIKVLGLTLVIPGYLVIAGLAYSAIITTTMMAVGRNLTRAIEGKNRAEAELRSVGAHLREQGESAAPPDGGTDDRRTIGRSLDEVIARWLELSWLFARMTLISQGSIILTPVAALILCAPKYLAGTMNLGEVVQAAAAFVLVQNAFNWITDNYARMADWTSSANRVASLLLALDQIDGSEQPRSSEIGGPGNVGLAAQTGTVAPD
jgi:vitamin B12/bleomycin/antimicrobial peptide transport system ATP-binding/permease protein